MWGFFLFLVVFGLCMKIFLHTAADICETIG